MAVRAEQIELEVLADSVLKEQIPDMMHFGQHTEFMTLFCLDNLVSTTLTKI